jgi:hypothetical protein
MSANPSVQKREKERARAEKQRAKEEKRKQRRTEAENRPAGETGADPDLAGIVWGPQPVEPELFVPVSPILCRGTESLRKGPSFRTRSLPSATSLKTRSGRPSSLVCAHEHPCRAHADPGVWIGRPRVSVADKLVKAVVVGLAFALAFGVPALSERHASARCPNEAPATPACVPLASWALPTLHADFLFPTTSEKRASVFAGGGFDLTLLSWSNNIDSFGPSQGALRLGASVLHGAGAGAGTPDQTLVTYRFSTLVSFEGNASRRFLIPTFGTAIGGLWSKDENARAAAEANLGLYLFYTRHVIVDVQGGLFVPLSSSQALFGPKAQLTASFALW